MMIRPVVQGDRDAWRPLWDGYNGAAEVEDARGSAGSVDSLVSMLVCDQERFILH